MRMRGGVQPLACTHAGRRGQAGEFGAASSVADRMLSVLLTEMDGLESASGAISVVTLLRIFHQVFCMQRIGQEGLVWLQALLELPYLELIPPLPKCGAEVIVLPSSWAEHGHSSLHTIEVAMSSTTSQQMSPCNESILSSSGVPTLASTRVFS